MQEGITQEKQAHRLRKILIILYIAYLAGYCALDALLGLVGMEYRTWFEVVSLLYLWLYPVVGIGYLFFAWRERKTEERRVYKFEGIQESSGAGDQGFRLGTGLLLTVYGIVMTVVSFFMLILMIFTVGSEERLENGILKVEKSENMYGEVYEYYEPVAFFFRKRTDWRETADDRIGQNEMTESAAQDASEAQETEISGDPQTHSEQGQNSSGDQNAGASDKQERNTQEQQDIGIPESNEQEETVIDRDKSGYSDQTESFLEEFQEKKDNARYLNVYDEDRLLADAVWLIYEKHYIDNPNSESEALSFYYNAKGNFYAKVIEKEHSCVLLVYNGMSENGKCQLFVAEEEHYDVDGNSLNSTSLLEFYAVDLEAGEVYEAHKTSWGGAESEEYRKATRE